MGPRILYVWFDGEVNRWRASWTRQIGRVLQIKVQRDEEIPHLFWGTDSRYAVEIEN